MIQVCIDCNVCVCSTGTNSIPGICHCAFIIYIYIYACSVYVQKPHHARSHKLSAHIFIYVHMPFARSHQAKTSKCQASARPLYSLLRIESNAPSRSRVLYYIRYTGPHVLNKLCYVRVKWNQRDCKQ